MRVLAVSDQVVESIYSPAVREIARGVDLVLSCGDLPSTYLEYIVSTLDVPLMYVMGNHAGAGGEKEFPDGCQNLNNRIVDFHGLLIAGLQGSNRYNARGIYQYTENEMRFKVAGLLPTLYGNRVRRGRYLDILVAHAPPYGIHDGRDLAHRGFKSFLWLIDHFRPMYLLHGHQHVYDRRTVTESIRGSTLVVNAFGYKIIKIDRPNK